ncbi:hypothetical protein C0J52_08185 [Blattella germanica]|nr:hypothetical protein C0J52_08185 [Blattella germanica]
MCATSLATGEKTCPKERLGQLSTILEVYPYFGPCLVEFYTDDIREHGSPVLQVGEPNVSAQDCTFQEIKSKGGLDVFNDRLESCLLHDIKLEDQDETIATKLKTAAEIIIEGIPIEDLCSIEEMQRIPFKELVKRKESEECVVLLMLKSTASL